MICVDFDAIKQNALYIKNKLGSKKLCAVVKNNAYGHGLEQVANAILDVVDAFAVGSVREGLQLRGYGKDILVLLPPNKMDAMLALSNGLVVTIDSLSTLKIVVDCARYINKVARVHIKLDTGMHRLGFDEGQLKDLPLLLKQSCISVEGVFSHFACADNDKCFTDSQFDLFCRLSAQIERFVGNKLTKHIANTSATLSDDRYHLDMVRVGLGLYGYGCDNLIPAKTLLANVVAIKHVEQGESVGYGASFRCCRPAKLAVLDVGYADGFSRAFSCLHFVDIGKNRCKQEGNVCMGMMMVDVTGTNVSVGDVAVLFGKNTHWNRHAFIYEALCNTR